MTDLRKRQGKVGELLSAIGFLNRGFNVFLPMQTGKKDLIVELGQGNNYGVQCKSATRPSYEPQRKKQRYRFSFKRRKNEAYDPKNIQIYCCVPLDLQFVFFTMNTGKKQYNIIADTFTQELEDQSFATLLKGLKIVD